MVLIPEINTVQMLSVRATARATYNAYIGATAPRHPEIALKRCPFDYAMVCPNAQPSQLSAVLGLRPCPDMTEPKWNIWCYVHTIAAAPHSMIDKVCKSMQVQAAGTAKTTPKILAKVLFNCEPCWGLRKEL